MVSGFLSFFFFFKLWGVSALRSGLWSHVGLFSTRNISCTNEDGWEDGAKCPTAGPAPTEKKHKPKDAGLIRGPRTARAGIGVVILGLPT